MACPFPGGGGLELREGPALTSGVLTSCMVSPENVCAVAKRGTPLSAVIAFPGIGLCSRFDHSSLLACIPSGLDDNDTDPNAVSETSMLSTHVLTCLFRVHLARRIFSPLWFLILLLILKFLVVLYHRQDRVVRDLAMRSRKMVLP